MMASMRGARLMGGARDICRGGATTQIRVAAAAAAAMSSSSPAAQGTPRPPRGVACQARLSETHACAARWAGASTSCARRGVSLVARADDRAGGSSRGSGMGFGFKDGNLEPVKQSDTMRALSELSNQEGRVSNANNLVLDGEMTFDQLDEKVNVYPQYRPFCAIGSGGDEFVKSIVEKAETALGRTIPQEQIKVRPSKEGKWVSVKLGPIYVEDKDTVVAVYSEIKKESRVRYCL